MINFLEPNSTEPQEPKEKGDKIRNILSIGILTLGLVFSLVFHGKIGGADASPTIKKFLQPLAHLDLSKIRGGDVVVPPPIPEPPKIPLLQGELIASSTFTAQAMFVKDVETGTVLYEKSPEEVRPLASITKLMSALVLLEKPIDWEKKVTVVQDDLIDTHMYAGDTYTIEQLWNAALVGSSNKAVMTLVDGTGWDRTAFVERMNRKSEEIGMKNAHFVEPTGLSSENSATAKDVSLLLEEALKQEKIRSTVVIKEGKLYSAERQKSHHYWSTNWLLLNWVPSTGLKFIGGKTGYISASGYNFTMKVENDRGHALDVVILGAEQHEERFTEGRDIAEWVYKHYVWPADALATSSLEIASTSTKQ